MHVNPPAQSHSFDYLLACELGVEAAVVYNHILYWLRHNFKEGKNRLDEKTWTYQTYEKMQEYLEYFSVMQIRGAIKKLVETGYLIRGEFNKNKFDHTTWYTISNSSYEDTKLTDRSVKTDRSRVRKEQFEDSEITDPSYSRRVETYKEKSDSAHAIPDEKIRFGQHVLFSKNEHEALCSEFGALEVNSFIERCNNYIASKGAKPYKDYSATFRNWRNRDQESQKYGKKPKEILQSAINHNLEARKAKGGEPITARFYALICQNADRDKKPQDKLWYIVEKDGKKELIS